MSVGADLYQQLLGIGPAVPRPINIYSLLGAANFEPNAALLLQRVEEQRRKLARFTQPGLQPAVAQLHETLAKAEQILRSPDLKARYDAKLRGTPSAPIMAQPIAPPTPAPPLPPPAPAWQQAPPINPSMPATPPPPNWPGSAPQQNLAPQIQVTSAAVRPSAMHGAQKGSLAKNPLLWGLAGLGAAVLAGLMIWLWPHQDKPIAKVEKLAPVARVPLTPAPAKPTPPQPPPAVEPPAPVTPAPVLPPEAQPDPRRVGKILSTAATPSEYLIVNEELQVSKTKAHDEYFVFGDEQWVNYDFEFECCVDTQSPAICSLGIVVRCAGDNVFGSVETLWDAEPRVQMRLLEKSKSSDFFLDYGGSRKETTFEAGTWQKFRVDVRAKRVFVRRNDKDVLDQFVDYLPHRGKVGFHVGSNRDCVTRFRNIKVTDPQGNLLWSGPPAPDRNYTAIQKIKPFTQPLPRLDPAKTPRREVPENPDIVYKFDGQSKQGWVVPQESSGAKDYWLVEEGKLTFDAARGRGSSDLRLEASPLRNFVFQARMHVAVEGFRLTFRSPPLAPHPHPGVMFQLAREGMSGNFVYPTWMNDPSTAGAPQETFDLEVIAAEDCFEAKLNGRTINLHWTRLGAPQLGLLWISPYSTQSKLWIEQLQVARLPDDFQRLDALPQADHERIVWKSDSGQFERQRNSSWIGTNDQGKREVYREITRNDFSILLQSLDGKTRLRLRDNESEFSKGPFGMQGDEKYYVMQHAGQFVGASLRQIPSADPSLTDEAARANAEISPATEEGMEELLTAVNKQQELAKQQSQLLFQTYYKALRAMGDPLSKQNTNSGPSQLLELVDLISRNAQLSKKPYFFAVCNDFYLPNTTLLQGINESQERLNRFYQQQIAQLTAAGKTKLAERLQELQRIDSLAQPLEMFTVDYKATPLDGEHWLTCLSDFTIREFPEQRLIWEYASSNRIVIKGKNDQGQVVWQDELRLKQSEARNPLFVSYGTNKTGKIYSIVPRGIPKK